MFRRQTTGSVVCASCGYLVGVNDAQCYHCGRRNPGLWGFAQAFRQLGHDMGFVPFVMGTCIVLYTAMIVLSGTSALQGQGLMSLLAPSTLVTVMFGAAGVIPIFGLHRWWTLLSASWLHGSLLHIGFNLLWIRQLAPAVGEFYGPGRMIIIYTVSGVCGFALSTIVGSSITLGASASILGLLGALVYYGRRTGSSHVGGQAWSWAISVFVMGLLLPNVDNWAHAGGFAGGFLAARFLDPLKPERIDHLVAAVVCLALSLLSIVVSIVHSFWLPR